MRALDLSKPASDPGAPSRVEAAPAGAVLPLAGYYGTLAAARSLGRRGIRVTVADPGRFAAGRFSRHVARSLDCPEVEAEPRRFLAWLLALGRAEPGQALFATSDGSVWLFARHRDELSSVFRLSVPPLPVIETLLNKWRLHAACRAAGVDAPETRLLATREDVERARAEARFPAVLKPQTQAFFTPHVKGVLVPDAAALEGAQRELAARARHERLLLSRDPAVAAPLLQTFSARAAAGIYNLSGFIDETGELFVAQASRKVLQWPRRIGVGICFEEADVVPSVAEGLQRLCRRVGYHGPFEVEFLEEGGRHLLLDFNPRLYGQMQFDIARGLDLPLLVYLAASGRRDELRAAVEAARQRPVPARKLVYCHRVELEIVLRMRRWAGQLDAAEEARWRAWLAEHEGRIVDPVLDAGDPAPGVVEAATALLRRARHPRSAWRQAREG